MVSLRQLQIFIEVATLKKMTLASERLFVSQPTISQAISEIESQYNVRLFERFGRQLELTPQGKHFFKLASSVLAAYDNMNRSMEDYSKNRSLRIGATITLGARIANQVLKAFSAQNPDIDINLYVHNIMELEQRLFSNELDVAIISIVNGLLPNPDLIVKPLVSDRLMIVCSTKHPLASRSKVTLEDLCNEPFILSHKGNGTRTLFEEKIASRQMPIKIKCECPDIFFIIDKVIDNMGLAIISERLIEHHLEQGRLKALEIDGCYWYRDFCVAYHKRKFISEPLEKFLACCDHFTLTGFADLAFPSESFNTELPKGEPHG